MFAQEPDQQKHRGVGPADYEDRPDEQVQADVNEALTQDAMLDPSAVTVSVQNGRVTLTGIVASDAERLRAEECARSVHGANECDNQLTVSGTR
ncbi:MAG: BON domain-containing protein [Pseudorhizobium sp.]